MHRVSPLPCQFPHKGHPLSLQIFKAPEPRRFHPHRWQGSFPGAGSVALPPPAPHPVSLLLWCTCCHCRPPHIRKPNGSIHSSHQTHASVQEEKGRFTWQPINLATWQHNNDLVLLSVCSKTRKSSWEYWDRDDHNSGSMEW